MEHRLLRAAGGLAALLALSSGCSLDLSALGGTAPRFPPRDAMVVDSPMDGARGDAGIDGGADAGMPDAGVPDTGEPDTGMPDAGPVDTGTGAPDAGAPDAGCPAGCSCTPVSCGSSCDCSGTSCCNYLCENSNCILSCINSSTCAIAPSTDGRNYNSFNCEHDATCLIDATGTSNTNLRCQDDSTCDVDCTDASNCAVDCDDSAHCRVDCTGVSTCNRNGCSGGGWSRCGSTDVWVCRHAC